MSYLVLARKFRPQSFASVVGQEHITTALANAILRNRVPHALLLTGPRGTGKTSSARVLARALNCNGRELPGVEAIEDEAQARLAVEPCGECTNCIEIAKSSSLAVWEIDGASNNSVENVRELIESLRSMPPPGSRYKIYIIDEVHMLSTAAFNALLKSLEEPPPNTIFIFATTEPHKIPETVISRCQRHDFRRLTSALIASCLKGIAEQENIKIDDSVFQFIARKSRGGMRDAQSMLDRLLAFAAAEVDLKLAQQVFGMVDTLFFSKLSQAIFDHEIDQCFALLDEAFVQSIDLRTFIGDFLAHWRNLLIISFGAIKNEGEQSKIVARVTELSEVELRELKQQVSEISTFDIQRLFDIAEKSATAALASNFPRYVIEAGVAKMATLSSLKPIAEIVSSLHNGGLELGSNLKQTLPSATKAKLVQQVTKNEITNEVSSNTFNPSWQDFVNYVRAKRSEVVLAAFLRRVSAKKFTQGVLEVEAAKFDLNTLKESENLQKLKDCLYSYSGSAQWQIKLTEADNQPQNKEVEAKNESNLVEGSIAAQEAESGRERVLQVEKEAREQELVKSTLELFTGSKIEKISLLKSSL